MSTLQLAHKYLQAFLGEVPIEEMRSILSNDLLFDGPLLKVNCADAYISALKKDPLEHAKIKIIDEFENQHNACIIYELIKPDMNIPVVQWFKTDNGKIKEIRILFDTARLK